MRLANDRYEQFQLGIKRHSVEMDVTIVADRKSGKFEILKVFYKFNGGGRANFSFSVAQVGATAAQSIYYFPNPILRPSRLRHPQSKRGRCAVTAPFRP
mgnify:CR=1 FL=1